MEKREGSQLPVLESVVLDWMMRYRTGEIAPYSASLLINTVRHYDKKSAPSSAQQEWTSCPDSQGYWWHWDGDKEHVPFMYNVLTSLSRKINREFIAYPDSRWCNEIGGFWLKQTLPAPPVTAEVK